MTQGSAKDLSQLLRQLEFASEYRFGDWPNDQIPIVAAGVYTVWQADRLLYVGMAGRNLTLDAIESFRAAGAKNRRGLADRLNSHASGRRSGDQFCIYICDRLVLPTLTLDQIEKVGRAELSLDRLTKEYIRSHLSYRFIEAPSGQDAFAVEREAQAGALSVGRPRLNPG
jgi:hypothetical protein